MLRATSVPIGSVATIRFITGPDRVAALQRLSRRRHQRSGGAGIFVGSGDCRNGARARADLPTGYGYEWTELAFQQRSASGAALIVFPLCVLLVFLILAAQYESWALPLAIVLIVPMCVLFSLIGVWLSGWDNNVLTQIGFIVLVGLACKNAILIVEFARERVEQGMDVIEAAIEACRLRLRPILMTSFAFIMGVVPLVDCNRRRQRNASRDGHRGVLRHAGRHAVRPVPHAGVLRHDRNGIAAQAAARPGVCAGGSSAMKSGACALVLCAVTGCAVGPNYREPTQSVPDQFSNAAQPGAGDGAVIAQFWTLLNDPVLDRLVSDALAANKDLAQAAGNLRASRAAARLTGFDAFPTVTAGGFYSRSLVSGDQLPGATREQRTIDTYDAGFDATWELDFFGRVRRSKEAARADVGAAEATLRDAIVIVTAEVARNYCVLRGLQDQLAVAERNEVNQRKTLDLTQVRLDAGRGTQLDVSRAAAQLATTEATIPPLRSSIAITIHRLSVLTGRQPNVLAPELSVSRPMPTLPALDATRRSGGAAASSAGRAGRGAQSCRRDSAHRRLGSGLVSTHHVHRFSGL